MTHFPEISSFSLKEDSTFFSTFLRQLEIQSGTLQILDEETGNHPDILIRNCLKGLLVCLIADKNKKLTRMIVSLTEEDRHLDVTHLADLIARVIQYIFRKNSDTSYLQYTCEQWEEYFCSISSEKVTHIRELVMSKEVATHVLTRYRGLSALSFLFYQQVNTPLKIADIGCSLNFGLRAAVKGTTLQRELDTLQDMTEDHIVFNSIKSRKPSFEYALGIDIQQPDFEWVAACAYFSKYDENRKILKRYNDLIQKDKNKGVPIHSMVADISSEQTVALIKNKHTSNFHIMYASMIMYQLSKTDVQHTLKNISSLLDEQGIFVELTFKNLKNWFLPWNTVTTVRFKEDNSLSKPYYWLEWDSSRCNSVQPSRDFQAVNLRLANLKKPV